MTATSSGSTRLPPMSIRMTRLVDDLLDVSRLKSGSLEIRSAPADLCQIARDVGPGSQRRLP